MTFCSNALMLVLIAFVALPLKATAQVVDRTEIESINTKNSFSAIETLLSTGYPIDTIVFLGKYTIQDFILKNTSLLKKGDTLTEKNMLAAYSRIFNLQLFNTVVVSAKRFDPITIRTTSPPVSKSKSLQKLYSDLYSKVILEKKSMTAVVISLDEGVNTTIYPIFRLLGTNLSRWIKSPNLTNVNVSIVATYKNATTYNDVLSFGFGAGFNSFFDLYYYYPHPFRNLNFGIGFGLFYSLEKNLARGYSSTGELILTSNENTSGAGYNYSLATGSIYFNIPFSDYSNLNGTLKLNYVDVPRRIKESIPLSLISPSDRTIFPILSFSYKHEIVDLLQYPMNGLSFYGSVTQYGFPWKSDAINLTKLYADFKLYLPLLEKSLSFGIRQMANVSLVDNPSPNHERVFFGYTLNIRGYVNRTFEGDNQMLSSFELRYALIPIRLLPFDFTFGLLPKRFLFGCFITAFFDAGNIWYNPSTVTKGGFSSSPQFAFDFSKWKYGYGVGISIVAGYNITLRFDTCMSSDNQLEFVLSNSVSF